MRLKQILILLPALFVVNILCAQEEKQLLLPPVAADTIPAPQKDTLKPAKDTVITSTKAPEKPKHIPQKATRRSAILPGWGQIYNGQYWKLPLVYAAIGIPAYTFVYNNTWYKKTRDAYEIVVNEDTANYDQIDPKLQGLDAESLQYYRNDFRRNRDYSILFFLIAWGLNVVDATVSGHLKEFDVSDDLSMKVQPQYNPMTKSVNVGLAFHFKDPPPKMKSTF